uniref:Uncharacterized protein LOC111106711 isoform X2 n=1 Tax=Crassostrea virginica TaxID=6565 RepID=A0A8B8B1L2_CRAVI|nr:uncharacterized protein LOC111106711 isoform X2 [Crassostrea virginica]
MHVHFRQRMQPLCGLVVITVLFIVISCVNASGYTWFNAQEMCRSSGETLVFKNNTSEYLWTSYYHRMSQWIGQYGCYQEGKITGIRNQSLHLPSAGYCQELCLETHKKSKIFFFAIKNKTCVCLDKHPGTSVSSVCSFLCLENQTSPTIQECGGESEYSVFLSRKDCSTCGTIETNTCNVCCFKNSHLNSADKCCASKCGNHKEQCCINMNRHMYTSYDKGHCLSGIAKENVIKCQRCKSSKGCEFVECNKTTDRFFCSGGTTFPSRYSTQSRPRTERNKKSTKSSSSTITSISKKFTKDLCSFLANEKVITRVTTVSVSHFHKYSSTMRTVNIPMDDDDKDDRDLPFHVGILASTIGLSIICLGLFAFCLRKRNSIHYQARSTRQRPSSAKDDASVGELVSNRRSPSTQNYSFNYSLADNNKLNNQHVREKEEPYHHLGQSDSENNENDNYTMVGYNSNTESVHFVEGESNYNYLRETMRLRDEEDDTYSHATNVNPSNSSNYSVVNMKRNSREIIGADLYGHFESRD